MPIPVVKISKEVAIEANDTAAQMERKFRRSCKALLIAIAPEFLLCVGYLFYNLLMAIIPGNLTDTLIFGILLTLIPVVASMFGSLSPILGLFNKYRAAQVLAGIDIALILVGGLPLYLFMVFLLGAGLLGSELLTAVETILFVAWIAIPFYYCINLSVDAGKLHEENRTV